MKISTSRWRGTSIILSKDELVWTQWILWDNVSTNLSRNLNEKPVDPLTEIEYTYSVINSQTKYELLSIYESDLVSYNFNPGVVVNNTNAASSDYPKVDWNYNWLFVKTTSYYIPTPSIITSEQIPELWLTLDPTNIKSQIITGWDNVIWLWNQALDINLSVYTWSLDSDSSTFDRQEFITQLQWAYTWTSLATTDIYKDLLAVTNDDDEIEKYVDFVVLNNWTYSSSSNTDIILDCSSSTVTWIINNDITYIYGDINNSKIITWTWTKIIDFWTQEFTADILCDSWNVTISNELGSSIICNNGYILDWIRCRATWAGNVLFAHWTLWKKCSHGNIWYYNYNPWSSICPSWFLLLDRNLTLEEIVYLKSLIDI